MRTPGIRLLLIWMIIAPVISGAALAQREIGRMYAGGTGSEIALAAADTTLPAEESIRPSTAFDAPGHAGFASGGGNVGGETTSDSFTDGADVATPVRAASSENFIEVRATARVVEKKETVANRRPFRRPDRILTDFQAVLGSEFRMRGAEVSEPAADSLD